MEPIVSVLKFSKVVCGLDDREKTLERGTPLLIKSESGNPFQELTAFPIGVTSSFTKPDFSTSLTLTLTSEESSNAKIGHFIHSPTTNGKDNLYHTIYFQPDDATFEGWKLAILAEPVTIGGTRHDIEEASGLFFCKDVYVSAAVKGVTEFAWRTDLSNVTNEKLDESYAGGPVYLKTAV